jgi:SAM-dependent methyltransferase
LLREADRLGRPLQIICHGDGLGLDAAAFAEDRHEVTYFEYPGPSERFARLTFAEEGRDIDVVTDAESLPRGVDVVTSFDVLEHVPDPRATVRELVHLLRRPGGLLLVHAPFYLIHRRYPTHLTSNRRHAGSTRLYEREGLRLIDGNIAWNPLALRLEGDAGRADPLTMLRLKLLKQALKLGRHTTLPFVPFQRWARRSKLSSTR